MPHFEGKFRGFSSAHLSWSVSSPLSPCSPLSFLQCCFPELWPVFCASHSDCPLNRLIGPQTSVAISKLMVHFWCSALTLSSPSVPCTHPTYVSKCGSQEGLRLPVPRSGLVVHPQACSSSSVLHPWMSVSCRLPRTEKPMPSSISSPSAPVRSSQISRLSLPCLTFLCRLSPREPQLCPSAPGELCQPHVDPRHPPLELCTCC